MNSECSSGADRALLFQRKSSSGRFFFEEQQPRCCSSSQSECHLACCRHFVRALFASAEQLSRAFRLCTFANAFPASRSRPHSTCIVLYLTRHIALYLTRHIVLYLTRYSFICDFQPAAAPVDRMKSLQKTVHVLGVGHVTCCCRLPTISINLS